MHNQHLKYNRHLPERADPGANFPAASRVVSPACLG
jgi:hypothetical protein